MSVSVPNAPLIITAELPPDIFSWATQLRTENYPPERNHLKAHVTLFRALPPSAFAEVSDCIAQLVSATPPVPAQICGVMKLGKGTALDVYSPDLLDMWEEMAGRFFGLLTPQDEHAPRLHITIQNKVSIEEAKVLQAELSVDFMPKNFTFRGLEVHAYRQGPWEFIKRWRFRG